jgi:DNA polymerase III sliding clamp (beta) subunit (PCNA family)
VACDRSEAFVTYFNPDYVADCLKVVEAEQVTMEFTTENRQAAMKAEGGLIYVVMPVTPGEV